MKNIYLLVFLPAIVLAAVLSGPLSVSAQSYVQPDTLPPWVSRWAVTNVTAFSATINWTTNEPADGMVEFCTTWNHCNNFTPLVPEFTTDHAINLSGLNPGTRYYFWIYSRDVYGNRVVYGYTTFSTTWVAPSATPTPLPTPYPTPTPWPTPLPSQAPAPGPDILPPWVSKWSVTGVTPYAATINWTTNEPADGMVEFCTSWSHCNNFTPLVPGYTTDHVINLSGLSPYTRYYFWIYSRDMAGNRVVYGYTTFTTSWVAPSISPTPLPTPVATPTPWPTPFPSQTPLPGLDITPPWIVRWSVSNITATTATINWITNESADGMVEFCTSWSHCNNFTPLVPGYTTDHVINLSGLSPYTRYYFWIYSRDMAGNRVVYGYTTFTTSWVAPSISPTPLPTPYPTPSPTPTPYPSQTPAPFRDITPPWIIRWSVSNITANSATVNWITDEPSISRVEFCPSWMNCSNLTPAGQEFTTGHSANLTGLVSGKRYFFWIHSRDAMGNSGVHGYWTFMTSYQ